MTEKSYNDGKGRIYNLHYQIIFNKTMDTSVVLTPILGIIFTVLGLSIIVSKKAMSATLQEMARDSCGCLA